MHAQSTGAVEGRVRNAVTGDSLNNARVAIKGSARQTFTDAAGAFRLDNLPAGPVTLRVFFTGLDEQEVTVNVSAGQTAVQDLAMTSQSRYGNTDTTVKLDPFTVRSTRETNASMIAINEQRFAANITSVVATDEFGTMVDSNPGEFLKYLPGIDVDYFANNITGVSVRGLGANNTEINFDGMTTASMNAEAVGRAFEVQFGTMSDIARAEIRKLPLRRTAPTPSAAPSTWSGARPSNTASAGSTTRRCSAPMARGSPSRRWTGRRTGRSIAGARTGR